jgi:hypothetical protein
MTELLSCSYCHFSIRPRAAFLMVDYCPRCLAKRRVAEPLRPRAESPSGARTFSDGVSGGSPGEGHGEQAGIAKGWRD